jgi:hypothetical protein
LSREICVSPHVAHDVFGFEMLATIHLDDQLGGVEDKIDDVGTNRRLSPKAGALKSMCPYVVPNDALRIGHVAPQSFCIAAQLFGNLPFRLLILISHRARLAVDRAPSLTLPRKGGRGLVMG